MKRILSSKQLYVYVNQYKVLRQNQERACFNLSTVSVVTDLKQCNCSVKGMQVFVYQPLIFHRPYFLNLN